MIRTYITHRSAGMALCAILLALPLTTHAQEACGNIIEAENGEQYETPITNCEYPFGVSHKDPDITVLYGETELASGEQYSFLDEEHFLEIFAGGFGADGALYRREGADYVLIKEFFGGTAHTFTEEGTYSLVVTAIDAPVLIRDQKYTLLAHLAQLLLPRAHAAHGPDRIITFEVTEEGGISNILFLPGIQASRIYTGENGEEEKLWEPGGNGDVERLAMDEEGVSLEELYTRDVIQEIGGFALGGNIYKSFLQSLRDIGGPFDGPVVETFAYDWRRDVFDVVNEGTLRENGRREPPTTTVSFLADTSATGKTTIIAHSNGGLLAKAIMRELEAEGRADLVDRVIMIGTPQIGTPKALAALLHGYDQELLGGLLVDDAVVREVMVNMPGVYGLLPSEVFVDTRTRPLIGFDDSEEVAELHDAYGFAVTNMEEYVDFLTGAEGRADPGVDVRAPSIANETLLTDALEAHRTKLDAWEPPEDVEVYEIVGIGLPTLASIEYRSFQTAECFIRHCITEEVLKPHARFTKYGDETVVSESATILNKQLYLDLSLIEDYKHVNITESPTTQDIVQNILHGSSTDGIEFVSTSEPTFDETYDVHAIHSPARMHVVDTAGNVSGRTESGNEWRRDIPGSHYLEFGNSKYVVVPADIDYEVIIEGEEEGVYTRSVDAMTENNEEENVHTTTSYIGEATQISYEKEADEFSEVEIDWEGDGTIDTIRTLEGTHVEGKKNHPAEKRVTSEGGHSPSGDVPEWLENKNGKKKGFLKMPEHARELLHGIFGEHKWNKRNGSPGKGKPKGINDGSLVDKLTI